MYIDPGDIEGFDDEDDAMDEMDEMDEEMDEDEDDEAGKLMIDDSTDGEYISHCRLHVPTFFNSCKIKIDYVGPGEGRGGCKLWALPYLL